MTKELKQKLDARGRHQINSGKLQGHLEVSIRTQRPLSPDQEEQIRGAGYRLRSRLGRVSTGMVVNVEALENVAKLPFVNNIELSTPMFVEE